MGLFKDIVTALRSMVRKDSSMNHQDGEPAPGKDLSITLYNLKREDIKINIVARFEDNNLIIDGYDIGKTVEEAWGDSDYEYVMTIPAKNLPPLYRLLSVKEGDRKGLLKTLKKRYHENNCFSAIGKLLDENNIKHKTFTWT